MVDINHDQYKMLKRISKAQSIEIGSLTDEEKKICDFLCENSFVSYHCDWNYKESNLSYAPFIPRIESSKYEITEKGKAQIAAYKSTFYNIKTSMILSIISTFTAVLALIPQLVQWLQTLKQ